MRAGLIGSWLGGLLGLGWLRHDPQRLRAPDHDAGIEHVGAQESLPQYVDTVNTLADTTKEVFANSTATPATRSSRPLDITPAFVSRLPIIEPMVSIAWLLRVTRSERHRCRS